MWSEPQRFATDNTFVCRLIQECGLYSNVVDTFDRAKMVAYHLIMLFLSQVAFVQALVNRI